jgi:plasmid stabilization system protein ParE
VKRPLVVGPIAEREVEEAARWYEARELGLGRAFVHEVLRAFDAIEAEPESLPFLRAPYRRKLLDRFPYAVIYKATTRRVYVRAVAHGRRRPGYWDA